MQMLQSDWLRFWGNVYMSMDDKIPEKTKTKSFTVSRLQKLENIKRRAAHAKKTANFSPCDLNKVQDKLMIHRKIIGKHYFRSF